jgi:hypothetical protein
MLAQSTKHRIHMEGVFDEIKETLGGNCFELVVKLFFSIEAPLGLYYIRI